MLHVVSRQISRLLFFDPPPFSLFKVRNTINRALRIGEFEAVPSPPTPSQPSLPLSVGVYNDIIRRLGKVDRLSDVFEVLDGMSALGVESDHETLEFVTNAAVKEVEFETRAVSMKSLPNGEVNVGEDG